MKRTAFILVSLTLTLIVLIYVFQTKREKSQKNEEILKKDKIKILQTKIDGRELKVAIYKVEKDKRVILGDNLEELKNAEDIKKEKGCDLLTSAGFYLQEKTHAGLFIQDDVVKEKYRPNIVFNGFFYQRGEEIKIDDSPPKKEEGKKIYFAIQTGPLIKKDEKEYQLKIREDKKSRRILAMMDKENNLYLVTIFDPLSYFSGPYLSEISKMEQEIEEQLQIEIKDIINLDGGSHSAFIKDNFNLVEAAKIGSFFCIK